MALQTDLDQADLEQANQVDPAPQGEFDDLLRLAEDLDIELPPDFNTEDFEELRPETEQEMVLPPNLNLRHWLDVVPEIEGLADEEAREIVRREC